MNTFILSYALFLKVEPPFFQFPDASFFTRVLGRLVTEVGVILIDETES